MRKTIFFIAVLALMSFTAIDYVIKNNTAEVEQEEGMYIYYRSKPVKEYEYLGSYKVGVIMDNSPKLLFNKLVRKTKEKYPDANGIIINNEMDKCDAIRFK